MLAWQFGGESSGPLPQWRCLKLANVSDARTREGRWHEGGSHQTTQTCVSTSISISMFTFASVGENAAVVGWANEQQPRATCYPIAKLYPPSLRAQRSNPSIPASKRGLLRFARNDVDGPESA